MIDKSIQDFLESAHLKLIAEEGKYVPTPPQPQPSVQSNEISKLYDQAYSNECVRLYGTDKVIAYFKFKLSNNVRSPAITVYLPAKQDIVNLIKNSDDKYPYKFKKQFKLPTDIGKTYTYPIEVQLNNDLQFLKLPLTQMHITLVHSTSMGYLVRVKFGWNFKLLPIKPKSTVFYIKYGRYFNAEFDDNVIHHVMPVKPVIPIPEPVIPEPKPMPVVHYGSKRVVISVKNSKGEAVPGINAILMVNSTLNTRTTGNDGSTTFVIPSTNSGVATIGIPKLSDPNHKYTHFKLVSKMEPAMKSTQSIDFNSEEAIASQTTYYHYEALTEEPEPEKPIQPDVPISPKSRYVVLHFKGIDNAHVDLYNTYVRCSGCAGGSRGESTTLVKSYMATGQDYKNNFPIHPQNLGPRPIGGSSSTYWLKVYKPGYELSIDGKTYHDAVTIYYEPKPKNVMDYINGKPSESMRITPYLVTIYARVKHVYNVSPVEKPKVIEQPKIEPIQHVPTNEPVKVISNAPTNTPEYEQPTIAPNYQTQYKEDTSGTTGGTQKSNTTTYLLIGGAVVALMLLMKK